MLQELIASPLSINGKDTEARFRLLTNIARFPALSKPIVPLRLTASKFMTDRPQNAFVGDLNGAIGLRVDVVFDVAYVISRDKGLPSMQMHGCGIKLMGELAMLVSAACRWNGMPGTRLSLCPSLLLP